MMVNKYPEYFLQTQEWSKFWLDSSLPGHNVHFFETNDLSFFCYEYPWYLGKKFWYIPKGPVIAKQDENVSKNFKKLLEIVVSSAKEKNISFIKMDFEEAFTNQLEITNNLELITWLKNYLDLKNLKLSKKILQFLQTSTLDLESIQKITKKDLEGNLENFYMQTQSFWKTTNQNVRRYTKKSLAKGWKVSLEKTAKNFEIFWNIYNQTKNRQNFAIHPKSYIKSLYNQDFSRIIILSNSDDSPQAVWLGILSEKTLTYICGGNREYSFKNYGQYLIHLVAIKIAIEEDKLFYDLGGYNPSLGFGKFKEGYRGNIRSFLGPVDFVLDDFWYSLINLLLNLKNLFKK